MSVKDENHLNESDAQQGVRFCQLVMHQTAHRQHNRSVGSR